MKMPICKNCNKEIRGAAYSNRARDGYLDRACRDAEEKRLEEEYVPIEVKINNRRQIPTMRSKIF